MVSAGLAGLAWLLGDLLRCMYSAFRFVWRSVPGFSFGFFLVFPRWAFSSSHCSLLVCDGFSKQHFVSLFEFSFPPLSGESVDYVPFAGVEIPHLNAVCFFVC